MLTQFISTCQQLAASGAGVGEFTDAMRDLVSDPQGLAAAIGPPELPEPVPIEGVDHVVFEDESLTIVVVHVPPGIEQPPHEHLMTAIIGVYEGAEAHRFFNRTDTGLESSGFRAVGPGRVLTMGSEAVHAIASADNNWCRGIHVYLGSLSSVDRDVFDPDSFEAATMTQENYAGFCRPL